MLLLTNSEFAVIQIIAEVTQISGYGTSKLMKERGFEEWAKVSTVSVYRAIKSLESKKLIYAKQLMQKNTTGPLPATYKLTPRGEALLKQNVVDALSRTQPLDRRFDLGLTGMVFVSEAKVVAALTKRLQLIARLTAGVENKYKSQGGDMLPYHVHVLFEHSLRLFGEEKAFIASMIEKLSESQS